MPLLGAMKKLSLHQEGGGRLYENEVGKTSNSSRKNGYLVSPRSDDLLGREGRARRKQDLLWSRVWASDY